jgi:hypothetical protein
MYFFDSYALIEIIKGNPSYEQFKNEIPTCLLLNLFELHQALLREFNKKTADYWVNRFTYHILYLTSKDVVLASDLRFKHKEKKLSMTDCIGYIIAKRNKLLFLTGDEQFELLPHVKFVK